MSQPFIKFSSHTITNLFFILLIITSSILFSDELNSSRVFSDIMPSSYFENYTKLKNMSQTNDSMFKYKYEMDDFHVRIGQPSFIDLLISIFIVGFVCQEIKKV